VSSPTPEQVRQVVADLRACQETVRALVHRRDRDDPDRGGLVELWGDLTRVGDRLEGLVPQAARPMNSSPRVGEGNTGSWRVGEQAFMRRNRGPR
jgi:hypothetical protein